MPKKWPILIRLGDESSFPGEPIIIESGGGTGGIAHYEHPIIFSVLGCIDYTYSDDRHGVTGFRKILGRVEGNIVVGLPFVVGVPIQVPISPELLASGFPKAPPIVGETSADSVWFKDEDSGNYTK